MVEGFPPVEPTSGFVGGDETRSIDSDDRGTLESGGVSVEPTEGDGDDGGKTVFGSPAVEPTGRGEDGVG